VLQGVKAQKGGAALYVRAHKAVVLTSGDFGRNTDMLRAYSPIGLAAVQVGALGHTGDGLKMAQALGADLSGVYAIGGLPSTAENPTMLAFYMPIPLFSGNAACVAINSSGRRFFNETIGYAVANMKIFQQEGSFAWTIFDEQARQNERITLPNYAERNKNWSAGVSVEIERGLVLKGETFGELADKLQVDRLVFEETMQRYNGHASLGKDPEFGKTVKLKPIAVPPFYAVKAKPGVLVNLGGLKIDTQARVKHVSGQIIPRLYAAGISMTGGFAGELIPTSGLSIGIGITFGRIAGRNAAAEKMA
jgi:succinate dehydrogenase/fumarate reductase flavoprotein subunit